MPASVSYIKNPNIMEHPQFHGPIAEFGKNTQWSTLGDLHGNVMLFLYFAAQRGAIDITPEVYQDIAELYHNWSATPEEKSRYRALLKEIKVDPNAKIRLIGDEVCDRGMGDDLTFEGLDILKSKEAILSNHTAVFIYHYENARNKATVNGELNLAKFEEYFVNTPENLINNNFSASFKNLQTALKNGAITFKELIELYNKHKAHIKAFSYDYDKTGNLVIYSHAAVGKHTIVNVAQSIRTFLTAEEIARLNTVANKMIRSDKDMIPLIDMINRVVKEKLAEDAFNTILRINDGERSMLLDAIESKDNPNDNDINNVHGHIIQRYGKNRHTLDGFVGRYVTAETLTYHLQHTNMHLRDITYTSSCPWQQEVPSTDELNPEIPTLPQYPASAYPDFRWKRKVITQNTSILLPKGDVVSSFGRLDASVPEENAASALLYRNDKYDPEDVPLLYGEYMFGLATFRSAIYGGLFSFINGLIDFFTFNSVENKAAKLLTFPIRIIGEAIKYPLMLLSGGLGMAVGTVTAMLNGPKDLPFWAPIVIGFSEGIQPFSPSTAAWINAKFTQSLPDYERFNQFIKTTTTDSLSATWSSSYIASLAISLLLVSAVITASVLTGGGAGLGMIMPFVFGNLFGAPLVLSPVLAPLASAFGVTWPYIAGAMFVGGLTKFMSGVMDGVAYLFSPKKPEHGSEPLLPERRIYDTSFKPEDGSGVGSGLGNDGKPVLILSKDPTGTPQNTRRSPNPNNKEKIG